MREAAAAHFVILAKSRCLETAGGVPVKAADRAMRIGGMAFDRLYANIMFFSSLPFIYAEDAAQAQFDG